MDYKKNTHVERLVKFLPFGPGISEIIIELQNEAQKLDIKTQAIEFVKSIVLGHSKALVILTGNAGHGKTYICQKVLMEICGFTDQEAKKQLRDDNLWKQGIDFKASSERTRKLKIFKDMSELSGGSAAVCLNNALTDEGCVTITCINEGQLRDALSNSTNEDFPNLDNISDSLNSSIDEGVAGKENGLFVVNLNFQSVVADTSGERSFLEEAIQSWLNDERSWGVCRECRAAEEGCPINNNKVLLTAKSSDTTGALGERRARGIIHLFKMAELFGQIITIREMLIVMAFIITGNLDCKAVHARLKKRDKKGWQSEYSFYNNIFANNVSVHHLRKVPLLSCFMKFDPARVSRRRVDDRFIIGFDLNPEQPDLYFKMKKNSYNALSEGSGLLLTSSGSETGREEEERNLEAMKILRRRDFFDLWDSDLTPEKELEERAERIGYSSLADMVWLITRTDSEDKQRLVRIKNQLVAGLHSIQGLSPWAASTNLMITHSAFARLQRKVNLINGTVNADKIKLLKKREVWAEKLSDTKQKLISVGETVDYTEREVVLSVEGEEIPLNLERFEYVRKAGLGYLSKVFFQTDIRRILNFLAKVATQKDSGNTIIVSTPEKQFELAISEGLIQ